MGGPGASVLLREPLTAQQHAELNGWLQSISRLREENSKYNLTEFWLKQGILSEPVSECVFSFWIGVPERMLKDEEERPQVLAQLGYMPQQEIGIGSGCNDDCDHRTWIADPAWR